MAGRNSKPEANGRMAEPSRLDQYGERLAEDHDKKSMKEEKNKRNECRDL